MTKRDRSDLLLTVFSVWAAALLGILVVHYVDRNDPWITMLSRPVSLMFFPVLVACIPLLAAGSSRKTTNGDGDEGELSYLARKARWTSGTPIRMALVWLTSLIIFAFHGPTMAAFDYIWHNPWFLIFAPLFMSCIALVPASTLHRWRISSRSADEVRSHALWNGLIGGVIWAVILILCLIGVNSMKGAVGKVSVNIAIGVLLAGDLVGLWAIARKFRNSREFPDS